MSRAVDHSIVQMGPAKARLQCAGGSEYYACTLWDGLPGSTLWSGDLTQLQIAKSVRWSWEGGGIKSAGAWILALVSQSLPAKPDKSVP
eukprot:s2640_g18.t1